jgi:hypothetical protein
VITIFSIPKPFQGHIGRIQRNAIASWAQAEGAEVLLIGDDPGVAEVADEFGLRHEPEIERTDQGTPLISSAFRIARRRSATPLLAYINADIIMLSDFVPGIRRVRMPRFLLVGRRWETEIREPINFEDPGWEAWVHEVASKTGTLAHPDWIDYFVLPRESPLTNLPPFAVGRPAWDNWLISRARETRIPVIDATPAITAVHQRHDYGHIPGRTGEGTVWAGPEEKANRRLLQGTAPCGVWHATHVLKRRGPARALGRQYLITRWGSRHEVDGRLERVGRFAEPVLVPVIRIGRRMGLFDRSQVSAE